MRIFYDKHRLDQTHNIHAGFADEGADGSVSAQTARANQLTQARTDHREDSISSIFAERAYPSRSACGLSTTGSRSVTREDEAPSTEAITPCTTISAPS